MTTQLPDIIKSIVLSYDIHTVWQAVATQEGINGWWMPNTFKPVVGEDFTLSAGAYGESICKVTEYVEHEKLSFDWSKDWYITFRVKKISMNETVFTLIHSGWDESVMTEYNQPHSVVRGFMEEGWEKIVYINLPEYLQGK